MQKLVFFIGNIIRILRKHSFLTTLMVLLMTLSLVLLCTTFYQNNQIEENVQKYDETFGNKTYYFMYEALDDTKYYQYLEEDNVDDYKKMLTFNKSLSDEDDFTFVSINSQPIDVYRTNIPDIFLDSYEEGEAENSVFQMDDKTCFSTKTIQVSEVFFEEFDINVSEGVGFDKDDYIYSKDKNIPILLGSAYKDVFSIGETFSCNYLFEDVNCEVIGFVDENSFFYENDDEEFISCERYIIMPAMYTETDAPSEFDKLMLLQHTYGIITSDKGHEFVSETFDNILINSGLSNGDVYITSSYDRSTQALNNKVETYSAMTTEVSEHFKFILILLVVFTALSITISLCGFVREQHYNYGVYILCGSSFRDISINISLLTGAIILLSTVLATIILFIFSDIYLLGLIVVWLISLVIWLFITFVTIIYLRKMSLQDIIGGKE